MYAQNRRGFLVRGREAADRLLYEAKEDGRAHAVHLDAQRGTRHRIGATMVSALRGAPSSGGDSA